MRRTRSAVAVSMAVAGVFAFVPFGVANAYVVAPMGGCTTSGTASSTLTTSNVSYPCAASRARIDKYVQNYPTSYYGNFANQGQESSTGSVRAGTLSGNYFQDKNNNGSLSPWYRVYN